MEYLYTLLLLLGGIGAFLMGAFLLSENIGKLATGRLRKLFNKTSKKKLAGVGIGIASTALVQSSGLTTIMVVGLVNAGIMSLMQATTVIMGANIGTTITAQIAALQGFRFDEFAVCLTAIGAFIAIATKRDRVKTIGFSVASFGLIFMGLYLMKESLGKYPGVKESIQEILTRVDNPFLLLLIGIIFTALVQSSSAITSILISMSAAGLVIGRGGNAMLFIILGSNIGSCSSALISSIGANRNAKRAGIIHLLFNTCGALIFFVVLCIWKNFMDVTFGRWFSAPTVQIAMFHTAFNVLCTALFLPFTKGIVAFAKVIIPEKKEEKAMQTFLDKRFLSTPTIAIEALNKETVLMLDLAMTSVKVALDAFFKKDEEMNKIVFQKIADVSQISNGITDYLVLTATMHISLGDEKLVMALHHNNSDIVRISELADNITKYTVKSINEDLIFSSTVQQQIRDMHMVLVSLASKVKETLETGDKKLLPQVDELEDRTDALRKELIESHIERLNKGICKPASNSVFINLVSNLERIGDHLSFVAHSTE